MAGVSFDQIAKQLGYASRAGAYMAAKAALNRVPEPEVKLFRALNLERLNKARLGIWPRVIKGDEKAIDREIHIQEREAKYLGLDAPAKHELTGKEGGPIQIEGLMEKLRRLAEDDN